MGGEGGRKRRGGRAREEPISAGFGTWGGLYVRTGEGVQGAQWDGWENKEEHRIFLKKNIITKTEQLSKIPMVSFLS